jgi:hypothetical protein
MFKSGQYRSRRTTRAEGLSLWGGSMNDTFEMIAIAIERLKVAREHKDTIYLELCITSLTHALKFLQRHIIVVSLPEPEPPSGYPDWQ